MYLFCSRVSDVNQPTTNFAIAQLCARLMSVQTELV